MFNFSRYDFSNSGRRRACEFFAAAALLALAGCGTQSGSSGNFAATTTGGAFAITGVTLSPASVIGGGSAEVSVTLDQPAPAGGLSVQLLSSDDSVANAPATMTIPAGQTSAAVPISTLPVASATTISITAAYSGSLAGTSLQVAPAASSSFTIALSPSIVGMAPGHNGSTTVTTTVPSGYKHALTLSASNLPAGVSITFSPTPIPSPGGGSSKATIAVQSSVKVGTYAVTVKASDGTTSHAATLTLKLAIKDPGAKFRGCWYHSNGNKYQGVDLSVANPGNYPFNATLYHGATCNPSNWADEFGYGTILNFGGFNYIFWFADFHDQTDTSAIWQVGRDSSVCVNYNTAPDC